MEDDVVDFSKKGRNYDETEMDMTPMVDVTFLLLIFFMVTASFSLQKSQQLPVPEESDQPSTQVVQAEDLEDESIDIFIDSYNTYRITCGDFEAECPSDHELFVQLRRAREGEGVGSTPGRVQIKAHTDCIHQKVVTALDACSAIGIEDVQLETTEEDE